MLILESILRKLARQKEVIILVEGHDEDSRHQRDFILNPATQSLKTSQGGLR